MSQITVNEADLYRIARDREALLGGGALDAKRPAAWDVYGYPAEIPFAKLLSAYERGGAGHGAVHKLLDGCWQELPRIKQSNADKELAWETKVAGVLKAVKAWAKLKDFDRRNLVGRYAALIYRVRDGKQLREPLERAAALVDLVPVYEDQIRVTAWNTDQSSEQYGQPTMFQFQSRRLDTNNEGQPIEWLDVHPSRVQILAEGSVGDMFDGVPLLRAGFNQLIDLEKISGGSAEGYLKNSARTWVFEYDRDAAVQTLGADGQAVSVRQAHQEQARNLNRNIDAAIVMQGGKASTPQTSVADPSKPFEVAACMFAASVRIPFTILFGQQTGRLASDEDQADFTKRCKSRQANELTPMLEEFIKRMQACGAIAPGEFIVEWPDLSAPTDEQKLGHAEKMANINAAVARTPGMTEAPFDADEIRQAAGYTGRAAVDLGEGGDPDAT